MTQTIPSTINGFAFTMKGIITAEEYCLSSNRPLSYRDTRGVAIYATPSLLESYKVSEDFYVNASREEFGRSQKFTRNIEICLNSYRQADYKALRCHERSFFDVRYQSGEIGTLKIELMEVTPVRGDIESKKPVGVFTEIYKEIQLSAAGWLDEYMQFFGNDEALYMDILLKHLHLDHFFFTPPNYIEMKYLIVAAQTQSNPLIATKMKVQKHNIDYYRSRVRLKLSDDHEVKDVINGINHFNESQLVFAQPVITEAF